MTGGCRGPQCVSEPAPLDVGAADWPSVKPIERHHGLQGIEGGLIKGIRGITIMLLGHD
jgi:hypothetical protein